jgi:hypothetical protein
VPQAEPGLPRYVGTEEKFRSRKSAIRRHRADPVGSGSSGVARRDAQPSFAQRFDDTTGHSNFSPGAWASICGLDGARSPDFLLLRRATS